MNAAVFQELRRRTDEIIASVTALRTLLDECVEGQDRQPAQADPENQMSKIADGFSTKSDKIRALTASGYSRSEIANFLDIRYQHVRNVEVDTVRQTTQIGYVNKNGQEVVRATGLPGTDHNQKVYALRCRICGHEYGANGSDIWLRKCPSHANGRPGLPID